MGNFYDNGAEPVLVTEQFAIPGAEIDRDDAIWRPMYAGRIKEDLTPLTQIRMCKLAKYLYLTNPLAHGLVELEVAFSVGGGIRFKANDDKVDQLLLRFWEDPVNAWDIKLSSRIKDLLLYGELAFWASINQQTGFVQTQFINPLDITKVIPDPRNVEILRTLELNPMMAISGTEAPILNIVNYDSRTDFLEGEALFFAINKSSDSPRGTSQLLALIDWLGLYDQLLFNSLERTAHMNAWYWDVSLEGYSDTQIRAWLNSQQGQVLKPGSIRAHNEKVSWNVVNPKLESAEISEAAKMFKLHILGGVSMPESFFGEVSAGRASLSEAQESTFKIFLEKQQYIRHMLRFIFKFVIDQAIKHQMLSKDVDRGVRIYLPKISVRDLQRGGGAALRFTQALEIGVEKGWLTEEQAKRIYAALFDQLGFGIEMREEVQI